MTERLSNRRIRLLLGLFALVFAGTLGRAVWLQGVQASTLERMAARQHEADDRDPCRARHDLRPDRRAARDRRAGDDRLRRPARASRTRDASRSPPRRRSASTPRSSTRSSPTARATSSTSSGRPIPAKAAALEKLNLPGLGFYAEELRYYPQRGVAAHVLGYAGVDNDGLEGLERSLDKPLIGKPGSQTTVTDPAGRVIDVVATKPERAGDDVFLTIDHRIQANAESVLRETVKQLGGEGRQRDRARPAHRRRARDGRRARLRRQPLRLDARLDRRRNRVVTDVYEPGSTFKVVTVAGGAVGEDRHADDGVHAAVARSASPTGSSTSTSRARPSG